ncbi:hypothetical protein L596_013142 [Steinernema carpocapsae]|uniref:Acid phosphatase n=1 Tax=Steinernema carpocapsae TaxID=34508 RepID=A0A4U5NZ84_STECR|nr:hypothetical protein L596_013142 [Steinernema carpocapsae]
MLSVVLLLNVGLTVADPELIYIQSVWRHGARTPIETYPTSPYQEEAWPVTWGEVTPLGMDQMYKQGVKLKEEYVDKYQLVSPNYHKTQTYVQSSDSSRALISAYAAMTGFYSGSRGTYPDTEDWPTGWTPIPVHAVATKNEFMLQVNNNCPRRKQLLGETYNRKEIRDVMNKNKNFLDTLRQQSKYEIDDLEDVFGFSDTLKIEKQYNMTLPAWITGDIYNKTQTLGLESFDCIYGGAAFGLPENKEMVRLTSGVLITQILKNIEEKINGTNEYLYHAYSAHDTTLSGLLRTLGAKQALLGHNLTDYGATVVIELWKLFIDTYGIKVRYSANVESPIDTITDKVAGCGKAEFCPLQTFVENRKDYIVNNITESCEMKNTIGPVKTRPVNQQKPKDATSLSLASIVVVCIGYILSL